MAVHTFHATDPGILTVESLASIHVLRNQLMAVTTQTRLAVLAKRRMARVAVLLKFRVPLHQLARHQHFLKYLGLGGNRLAQERCKYG